MKYFVVILILSVFIVSCDANKTVLSTEKNNTNEVVGDTIRIANDELEYEILIIEVGFDAWLATQYPMSYFSNIFLRNRNNLYVIEWNNRVRQPQRFNPNLYDQEIDFSTHIDYGKEVNYKLYMYFQFFERRYNQKLLQM